jgi:hypothetical protein
MKSEKGSTFRIHVGLVVAECICIPAGIFELSRALHGNLLSWAYVIEWPALAGYAVFMWAKMLKEERGEDKRSLAEPARIERQQADDPELRAWNDYLASIHGRPPHEDSPDNRDV